MSREVTVPVEGHRALTTLHIHLHMMPALGAGLSCPDSELQCFVSGCFLLYYLVLTVVVVVTIILFGKQRGENLLCIDSLPKHMQQPVPTRNQESELNSHLPQG